MIRTTRSQLDAAEAKVIQIEFEKASIVRRLEYARKERDKLREQFLSMRPQ